MGQVEVGVRAQEEPDLADLCGDEVQRRQLGRLIGGKGAVLVELPAEIKALPELANYNCKAVAELAYVDGKGGQQKRMVVTQVGEGDILPLGVIEEDDKGLTIRPLEWYEEEQGQKLLGEIDSSGFVSKKAKRRIQKEILQLRREKAREGLAQAVCRRESVRLWRGTSPPEVAERLRWFERIGKDREVDPVPYLRVTGVNYLARDSQGAEVTRVEFRKHYGGRLGRYRLTISRTGETRCERRVGRKWESYNDSLLVEEMNLAVAGFDGEQALALKNQLGAVSTDDVLVYRLNPQLGAEVVFGRGVLRGQPDWTVVINKRGRRRRVIQVEGEEMFGTYKVEAWEELMFDGARLPRGVYLRAEAVAAYRQARLAVDVAQSKPRFRAALDLIERGVAQVIKLPDDANEREELVEAMAEALARQRAGEAPLAVGRRMVVSDLEQNRQVDEFAREKQGLPVLKWRFADPYMNRRTAYKLVLTAKGFKITERMGFEDIQAEWIDLVVHTLARAVLKPAEGVEATGAFIYPDDGSGEVRMVLALPDGRGNYVPTEIRVEKAGRKNRYLIDGVAAGDADEDKLLVAVARYMLGEFNLRDKSLVAAAGGQRQFVELTELEEVLAAAERRIVKEKLEKAARAVAKKFLEPKGIDVDAAELAERLAMKCEELKPEVGFVRNVGLYGRVSDVVVHEDGGIDIDFELPQMVRGDLAVTLTYQMSVTAKGKVGKPKKVVGVGRMSAAEVAPKSLEAFRQEVMAQILADESLGLSVVEYVKARNDYVVDLVDGRESVVAGVLSVDMVTGRIKDPDEIVISLSGASVRKKFVRRDGQWRDESGSGPRPLELYWLERLIGESKVDVLVTEASEVKAFEADLKVEERLVERVKNEAARNKFLVGLGEAARALKAAVVLAVDELEDAREVAQDRKKLVDLVSDRPILVKTYYDMAASDGVSAQNDVVVRLVEASGKRYVAVGVHQHNLTGAMAGDKTRRPATPRAWVFGVESGLAVYYGEYEYNQQASRYEPLGFLKGDQGEFLVAGRSSGKAPAYLKGAIRLLSGAVGRELEAVHTAVRGKNFSFKTIRARDRYYRRDDVGDMIWAAVAGAYGVKIDSLPESEDQVVLEGDEIDSVPEKVARKLLASCQAYLSQGGNSQFRKGERPEALEIVK